MDNLKNSISDTYAKGKLNKEQYDKLADEISIKDRDIFNFQINLLDKLSDHKQEKELLKIKSIIEDAFARGRLNELHYKLLKEKISSFEKYFFEP